MRTANVNKTRTARRFANRLTKNEAAAADSYSNQAARLGAGTGNQASAGAYPLTRFTQQYMTLLAMYRSHWIVRKVVDVLAEDMLKAAPKLLCDLKPAQIEKFDKKLRDTATIEKLLQALKWGRLFGGGAALICIDGHDDLAKPLKLDDVDLNSYRGLIALDRWSGIFPGQKLVTDMNYPNDFGCPETYMCTFNSTVIEVHHTRLIRFSGRPLPEWEKQVEMYWGLSEIEVIFDELQKRDYASWNIVSLITRAQILSVSDDQLAQSMSGANKSNAAFNMYLARMDAMAQSMNNQGLLVVGKDGKLDSNNYSFGGLADVYNNFMMDIAGAAEIPVSRLYGRSVSGLGSQGEGDLQIYYDTVESKRSREVRPAMDKLLPVICMSVFGQVPKDFDYAFPPARTMDNKERAELAKSTSEAIIGAYEADLLNKRQAVLELSESSEQHGLFTNITDEDIAKVPETYASEAGGGELDMPGMGLGDEPAAPAKEKEPKQPKDDKKKGDKKKAKATKDEATTDAATRFSSRQLPFYAKNGYEIVYRDGAFIIYPEGRYKEGKKAEVARFAVEAKAKAYIDEKGTTDAEFKETEHPRDNDGKFKSGGASSSGSNPVTSMKIGPSVVGGNGGSSQSWKETAPTVLGVNPAEHETQASYQQAIMKKVAEHEQKTKSVIQENPTPAAPSIKPGLEKGSHKTAGSFVLGMMQSGKFTKQEIADAASQHFGTKTSVASVNWYLNNAKKKTPAGKQVETEKKAGIAQNSSAIAQAAVKPMPAKEMDEKLTAAEKKDYKPVFVKCTKLNSNTPVYLKLDNVPPDFASSTALQKVLMAQGLKPFYVGAYNTNMPTPPSGVQEMSISETQVKEMQAEAEAKAKKEAEINGIISSLSEKLKPEEVSSIKHYSNGSYSQLNSCLRKGQPLDASQATLAAHLDKAIRKHTINKDTTLYRGIAVPQQFFGPTVKVGTVVIDNGFISTSKKYDVAQNFSHGSGGMIANIKVRKGQIGADISSLSNHTAEKEIVLPRGSMFKVLSVMGKDVELEYIDGQ